MVHTMLEYALWRHAQIVHAGKTKIWNRAGVRPEACDFLERRARLVLGGVRVWRGVLESETHDRGIKIFGQWAILTMLPPVAVDQEASTDVAGPNSSPP